MNKEQLERMFESLSENKQKEIITAFVLPKIKYRMKKYNENFQAAFDRYMKECIAELEKGEIH